MIRRIAITGATSMLGLSLVREALDEGIGVAAIVRKSSKYTDMLPKGVDVVKLDMDEYADATPDVPSCDCFFHLAWGSTLPNEKDAAKGHAQNIIYTIDAVGLAHRMGCSAFIGAGSQSEYGVQDRPLTSSTSINPESAYGIAKFAAGRLVGLAAKQIGMKYNWMRIVSVYGPNGRVSAIIPELIESFSHCVCPKLTKCEQTWDFLYSADAARAMLAVADKGIDGKTYVLGSGEGHLLKEYVTQIRDIVNPAVQLQFGTMEYRPHQAMYLVADIAELTRDTGWKPVTRFVDGIRKIDRMRGGGRLALFSNRIKHGGNPVAKAAA